MTQIVLERLSQGQLNQLAICPPLFQRNYLEQMDLPMSFEQLERLEWGSRFHLLMQQRELGLPIEAFLAEDVEMGKSLNSLQEAAPHLFQPDDSSWREAEHSRSLVKDGYLLRVIYDLLIVTTEKATILDWKTYPLPENRTKLANNWQTRLYLYVLAETSHYQPEDISLTYWFVKLPHQVQSLTFNYNLTQHQQTELDLQELLTKLKQWLGEYHKQGTDFPHRLDCQSDCPYYSSLLGCTATQQPPDWSQLVSEIPEISDLPYLL